jgi:hypothetical protein
MKQIFATVLAFLQLKAFVQENGKATLTEEHKQKLTAEYGQEFTDLVVKALAEDPSGEKTDAHIKDAILTAMSIHVTQALANEKAAQASLKIAQDEAVAAKAAKISAEAKVAEHEQTIEKLSGKPEPEPGAIQIAMKNDKKWSPSGKDTHLFGIQEPFMAIDDAHPYNQRAYSAMLGALGVNYLSPKASSLDYSSLKADLGDFYRVRKQDRIQSFLQQLPSLTSIFPLESGYQDQAVLVNLFMDEFSQADSTIAGSDFEQVQKGGYKFEPEIIRMWDIMFVTIFKQLKALEKNWLGYLNREGSSTMKWSFIEYILVETAKKLKNEQEIRRVLGVRKDPTANVVGTALQAADGFLKFIKNQIALFKIQPFAVGEYASNGSDMAEYVYKLTGMVPQVVRDSGRLVLYMSQTAVTLYHKNCETLYALQPTYIPDQMNVHEYPNVKIVPVPNMGVSKRMVFTFEGNIILLEDQPGEMLNFNIEQKDWTLKVWSNWKESLWAYMTGKKFSSASEFPGDYSSQLIFCNDVDEPADYFINMNANDTTPSVLNHTSLVSVANTIPTEITNITDAIVGQEIRLKCGNASNAPTITAGGKFSLLTDDWTPEVGDVLYLKKRSDGNFIEIKRETKTIDAIVIVDDDATPDVSLGTKFVTSANTNVYTIYGGSDSNPSTISDGGNFGLTDTMTLNAGSYIVLQAAENGIFYEIERG